MAQLCASGQILDGSEQGALKTGDDEVGEMRQQAAGTTMAPVLDCVSGCPKNFTKFKNK